MDVNFCILLLYIFLRNVMAFDKGLAILYGFFSLRISKNTTPLAKRHWGPKHFFLILVEFYIKMHIMFCKNATFYVLN